MYGWLKQSPNYIEAYYWIIYIFLHSRFMGVSFTFMFFDFMFVSHPVCFPFIPVFLFPVIFPSRPQCFIFLLQVNPALLSFSCFFLSIFLSCPWIFIFFVHVNLKKSRPCPSFFPFFVLSSSFLVFSFYMSLSFLFLPLSWHRFPKKATAPVLGSVKVSIKVLHSERTGILFRMVFMLFCENLWKGMRFSTKQPGVLSLTPKK